MMSARELLIQLTDAPPDRVLPVLGKSLNMIPDSGLYEAATALIEHKIAETIAATPKVEEVEFAVHNCPFSKLAEDLNDHKEWDVIHLHVDLNPHNEQMWSWVLVTQPVKEKEDED